MNQLTRRSFISQGAVLTGAALLTPSLLRGENSAVIKGPIGFQTWIVRKSIEEDFPGTLKKMAALVITVLSCAHRPAMPKWGSVRWKS